MTAEELVSKAARAMAEETGMTQVEIAAEMGVGQSYVSKIMRGKAGLDALLRLAKACECHVEEIRFWS